MHELAGFQLYRLRENRPEGTRRNYQRGRGELLEHSNKESAAQLGTVSASIRTHKKRTLRRIRTKWQRMRSSETIRAREVSENQNKKSLQATLTTEKRSLNAEIRIIEAEPEG